MAHVSASFAVSAGAYAEAVMDLAGLTPDEMAEEIFGMDVNVSVCHQCARNLTDPEADELVGFTVDGVEYVQRDGHWAEA